MKVPQGVQSTASPWARTSLARSSSWPRARPRRARSTSPGIFEVGRGSEGWESSMPGAGRQGHETYLSWGTPRAGILIGK
eukprot:140749-Pyramimonas_sp.AAC.1